MNRTTTIAFIAGAFLLLAGATTLRAQTEIPGTVTAVDGRGVTIRVPGPLLPRAGDPVRLRFRDPVPGAGLVFVEGDWEVTVVRRGEVEAAPRGETAVPQAGLVALIASADPQPRDAVPEAMQAEPAAGETPGTDEPVAADVREREAPRIERRRWVWISAAVEGMPVQDPLFGAYEPDPAVGVGLSATLGVFVLPTVVVHGYLGAVRASGLDPTDDDSETVGELARAVGATLFFGKPGNVPGDIHFFVQGGYAWYDVHYGDFDSEAEATGTGAFGGAGIHYTIRPAFGLYLAGQLFTADYDGDLDPAFDRAPARIALGLAAIL